MILSCLMGPRLLRNCFATAQLKFEAFREYYPETLCEMFESAKFSLPMSLTSSTAQIGTPATPILTPWRLPASSSTTFTTSSWIFLWLLTCFRPLSFCRAGGLYANRRCTRMNSANLCLEDCTLAVMPVHYCKFALDKTVSMCNFWIGGFDWQGQFRNIPCLYLVLYFTFSSW